MCQVDRQCSLRAPGKEMLFAAKNFKKGLIMMKSIIPD